MGLETILRLELVFSGGGDVDSVARLGHNAAASVGQTGREIWPNLAAMNVDALTSVSPAAWIQNHVTPHRPTKGARSVFDL